jgi:hypothetical protein
VSDSIQALVEDVAMALAAIDATHPIGEARRFQPGIGPLTESELTSAVLRDLATRRPSVYEGCGPRGYPGSRAMCDIVLAGHWAIEIKLARPFGDNGKPAERWSENLLYPYPGNTSAIGDCLKLLNSGFSERRAVMVIGYEHSPPRIPVESAVRGFELLAASVCRIVLSSRAERLVPGLIHPHHQQARVCGWEVLGLNGPGE